MKGYRVNRTGHECSGYTQTDSRYGFVNITNACVRNDKANGKKIKKRRTVNFVYPSNVGRLIDLKKNLHSWSLSVLSELRNS